LIFKPDQEQESNFYIKAYFSGFWTPEGAETGMDTAHSRTGYVIAYTNGPVTWASKLQTQVALSTTEAEHLAHGTALREVIPQIEILHKMKEEGNGFKN
jgi:hypothetical protein